MPYISVNMLPGKTTEQKTAMIKEITEAVTRTCGTKPEAIWVTINEVDGEHWGIAGKPLR